MYLKTMKTVLGKIVGEDINGSTSSLLQETHNYTYMVPVSASLRGSSFLDVAHILRLLKCK